MPDGKPNILVLWGDDIGFWNLSCNNRGMMGYQTPNIDRLAREGVGFTDFYGQQSCTAGRAAFITGQNPLRTGLTKVGLPGADFGLRPEDPTIAELLKPLGYATAQFGKNHLGDLDEHLPTNHGFDEFFGNLYHLNAEEEPEHEDYPKDPAFKERFGPRGVIHSWAQPDGTQKIEDTGPLTRKRMETIDDEVTARTLEYLDEVTQADKPFFIWWNATRMHFRTHVKAGEPGHQRPGRVQRRHGRARPPRRHDPRQARRARHRRRHDRHVLDRQRPPLQLLAGRRHHALPLREEQQLGGRLPRAGVPALAGEVAGGRHPQRHRRAPGHADHVPGGGRRARHRRQVPGRARGRRQDLQGRSSTART